MVRQYQKLFKFEKVALEFTDEALLAVAELASTKRSGARGLRTILENVMLNIMYEVPSQEDVENVEITEAIVRDGFNPFEDKSKVPASG